MDNYIDLDQSVYQTTTDHPELVDILIDIGFTPLSIPTMRKTIGKKVSLRQGTSLIKISQENLIQELHWNGYLVKGYDNNDGK